MDVREILFRGKMEDGGEWIYGDLVASKFICIHDETVDDESRIGFIDVVNETVGQYTGVTDKNGAKIFEGDIVSINGSTELAIVHYLNLDNKSEFETLGWYCTIPKYQYYVHRLENNSSKYEVVGNIHDNPELLEEE